jgi:predicted DNA-binding WGR domain protein
MTIKYEFIGWCRDEVKNQDKVWVCIQLPGGEWYNKKFLTVWGRRGKRLQSKLIETSIAEMDRLARSKDSKGYREIPENKLHEVYPEFEQDLERTAAWGMLRA